MYYLYKIFKNTLEPLKLEEQMKMIIKKRFTATIDGTSEEPRQSVIPMISEPAFSF